MEEKAEYIVSQAELEEADQLLSSEPPITIEPARTIFEGGTTQGFVERRQSVYIKLSVTFLDVMSKLKGSRLSVFLCLALHINEKGICFPSLDTISEETGYSNMQVIRAIKSLEDDGFLSIKRKHRHSNIYKVDYFAAFGKGNDPQVLSNIMLPKSDKDESLGNTHVTQNARNVTQNPDLGNTHVTPTRKNQLKQEPTFGADAPKSKVPSIEETMTEFPDLFGDEHDEAANDAYKARLLRAIGNAQERQEAGEVDLSWLPEYQRPLARAFVDAAGNGHHPVSSDRSLWRKTLNEWFELKFTPNQITNAVKHMRSEGLTIGGIQSVTKTARDGKGGDQEVVSHLRKITSETQFL